MISASSQYALRALTALAKFELGTFVQVVDLSAEAETPGPYLAKVIKILAKRGVVITKKGKNGGVALGRSPISFYEVCESMDDPAVVSHCFLSRSACNSRKPCEFHNEWGKVRGNFTRYLQRCEIRAKSKER